MTTIKLIIFDLDGVLVEAKNIHFDALNEALSEVNAGYKIMWNEHLNKYDGLKTYQKLDLLTKDKGLPAEIHNQVWERKQQLTLNKLTNLKHNKELVKTLKELHSQGIKLAVCSNSIRPEMYWKAISMMSCLPEETLIVEDSPYGLLAASRSKSHILRVKNTKETTLINIHNKLNQIQMGEQQSTPAWRDEKLTVLIPMAGAGSRFQQAGYTFPKPLIDVKGKPMIQIVVDNLNIKANYVYVVQKEHREKYNLDTLLNLLTPGCKIVEVNSLTEGAACTALLAKEYIDNDNPLFFANSDQYAEWDSNEFLYKMNETDADGGIVSFKGTHPKYSFAKINDKGLVTEVAEKDPISDIATVGYYYWKKGSDFVKYAEQMIDKNLRVNNEFYVCPVFNEAVKDGKEIRTFDIPKMWCLGTPEDLKYYLENFK